MLVWSWSCEMTSGLRCSCFPANPMVIDSLHKIKEATQLYLQLYPHLSQICWNFSVSCCFPSYQVSSLSPSFSPLIAFSWHFLEGGKILTCLTILKKSKQLWCNQQYHHILSAITFTTAAFSLSPNHKESSGASEKQQWWGMGQEATFFILKNC